jgi:hypothetical protein
VPFILAPDNESSAVTHHVSDMDCSLIKQYLEIDMVKYCPKQMSFSMATELENYLYVCVLSDFVL